MNEKYNPEKYYAIIDGVKSGYDYATMAPSLNNAVLAANEAIGVGGEYLGRGSCINDWEVGVEEYYFFNKAKDTTTDYTPESTKPEHYKFQMKGIEFDVFDVARAMGLPNTLFMALKYFRVKGGNEKKINDLEKAMECISREIGFLKE